MAAQESDIETSARAGIPLSTLILVTLNPTLTTIIVVNVIIICIIVVVFRRRRKKRIIQVFRRGRKKPPTLEDAVVHHEKEPGQSSEGSQPPVCATDVQLELEGGTEEFSQTQPHYREVLNQSEKDNMTDKFVSAIGKKYACQVSIVAITLPTNRRAVISSSRDRDR